MIARTSETNYRRDHLTTTTLGDNDVDTLLQNFQKDFGSKIKYSDILCKKDFFAKLTLLSIIMDMRRKSREEKFKILYYYFTGLLTQSAIL